MKKTAAWIVVLGLILAGAARADTVITNYYGGYKFVPNTFADAGDTGLTAGQPYCCFPVTNLSTYLSTNQAAEATGDVRALVQALANRIYLAYYAAASTNRPTGFSVNFTAAPDTSTAGQIIETYRINVTYSPSGATLPSD